MTKPKAKISAKTTTKPRRPSRDQKDARNRRRREARRLARTQADLAQRRSPVSRERAEKTNAMAAAVTSAVNEMTTPTQAPDRELRAESAPRTRATPLPHGTAARTAIDAAKGAREEYLVARRARDATARLLEEEDSNLRKLAAELRTAYGEAALAAASWLGLPRLSPELLQEIEHESPQALKGRLES